ncbi:DUF4177 domain-containing protein [Loktanella sp. S4079]|uniref:DUF4177 domain-containing protein n=1 Tax=Loktanella sp. S4079 TaxID=579483 RepID=UPI0005FA149C|nr:DUF4177 domain-containing protein [Loktanella sp. S4079]KJZ20503.1 hypothetical protein TW80_06875 [Loktanella sp. S4079]
MSYEYKVVPAPTRGVKAKGAKSAEGRFAVALETMMNDLAADRWEYLRTDTLPAEQREGLMGKTTVYRNMLVFRREKQAVEAQVAPPTVAVKPPAPAPEKVEKPAVVEPKKVTPPEKPSSEVAAE